MIQPLAELPLADLYEADETAWLEATAQLLAAHKFEELDVVHLCEYLSDMAKRDRREVLSRLAVLLAHLLKWEHQPDHRSKSWQATIANQRDELGDLLESGTLWRHAEEVLPQAYQRARREAVLETGLEEEVFPVDCPFSLEQVLSAE